MRGAARDSQGDLTALNAGLLFDHMALDEKDLPDRGKVEGIIERGAAPNASWLKAAMIQRGDRIAQMVIAPVPRIAMIETKTLDTTDRGAGGFGSTGVASPSE